MLAAKEVRVGLCGSDGEGARAQLLARGSICGCAASMSRMLMALKGSKNKVAGGVFDHNRSGLVRLLNRVRVRHGRVEGGRRRQPAVEEPDCG